MDRKHAQYDDSSGVARTGGRPVLFIEGDADHSIDIRLYGVVFPEFIIRPLGSCDKVIESTRTLATFKDSHKTEIFGIVDRDRRSDSEVAYLRSRHVMVPNVAEIENIFLAQGVLEIMAQVKGKNAKRIVKAVRHELIEKFVERIDAQALEHTRYRVKRDVERKIDARFTCITALELHIKGLIHTLRPRETYDRLRSDFRRMANAGAYADILRVFNHKPSFTGSCASRMLGFSNSDAYISAVIGIMKSRTQEGELLRREIRLLFE